MGTITHNGKMISSNFTWEVKKNNKSLGLFNARTPLMALDKCFRDDLINNWDDVKNNYKMDVIDDIIVLEDI